MQNKPWGKKKKKCKGSINTWIVFYARVSHKSRNILIHANLQCIDDTTETVPVVVGSIVIVGVLTGCALLHWKSQK